MAKNEHSRSDDPDILRLQAKSQEGVVNVVGEILNDPKVQQVIKKSVLRETFSSGIVMACLFVGLMMLFNVAKTVIGFNWIGDLIISTGLIGIGLIYIFKNIFSRD